MEGRGGPGRSPPRFDRYSARGRLPFEGGTSWFPSSSPHVEDAGRKRTREERDTDEGSVLCEICDRRVHVDDAPAHLSTEEHRQNVHQHHLRVEAAGVFTVHSFENGKHVTRQANVGTGPEAEKKYLTDLLPEMLKAPKSFQDWAMKSLFCKDTKSDPLRQEAVLREVLRTLIECWIWDTIAEEAFETRNLATGEEYMRSSVFGIDLSCLSPPE